MTLLRPTLQGRKGFNPNGYGPGVNAPFGFSSGYFGGTRKHNGQDHFWLGAESSARLGISTADSKGVYPCLAGPVYAIDDYALGVGLWQQLDATHRIYYWHLSTRVRNGTYSTSTRIGVMGSTGTAGGDDDHLHLEVREAPYLPEDRVDPEPWFDALLPHQRQVLASAPVLRRSEPTSKSAEAGDALPAGTIGNFDGWIRGESVDGNAVWFRGISGNWFWSGGFTSTSTAGLDDLNPKPITSPKRTVRPDIPVANIRPLPTAAESTILGTLVADQTVDALGYARGQAVSQNGVSSDIWFRVAGGWVWSGAFTSQSTAGLLVTEPALPTTPPPGSVLDPLAPWKKQTPDSPLAKWVGSPNYNRWPASPEKRWITYHWMDGTLAGTDAHFQIPGQIVDGRGTNAATNYGIGQTEIHQYVREADYQHGDGNRESNTHGISIEHEGGPDRPITDAVYALSAKLTADIARRNGWAKMIVGVNMKRHFEVASTTCPGNPAKDPVFLDLDRIAREANAILNPVVVDNPPPVAVTPEWFRDVARDLTAVFAPYVD